MLKKADDTAQSAYGDLLKQKETIMGFNNHLGNVNTSIALAERYLRMMRDRDKRHRCYVFLMICGMFLVIGIGGAAGGWTKCFNRMFENKTCIKFDTAHDHLPLRF